MLVFLFILSLADLAQREYNEGLDEMKKKKKKNFTFSVDDEFSSIFPAHFFHTYMNFFTRRCRLCCARSG